MATNLIPTPLSERPLGSLDEVLPFLNKELVPLVRQIRAALNNRQNSIVAPTGGATIDAESRTAIVALIAAVKAFGVTE